LNVIITIAMPQGALKCLDENEIIEHTSKGIRLDWDRAVLQPVFDPGRCIEIVIEFGGFLIRCDESLREQTRFVSMGHFVVWKELPQKSEHLFSGGRRKEKRPGGWPNTSPQVLQKAKEYRTGEYDENHANDAKSSYML
jgi:hypothetical protein